jgi:hypothetical protein
LHRETHLQLYAAPPKSAHLAGIDPFTVPAANLSFPRVRSREISRNRFQLNRPPAFRRKQRTSRAWTPEGKSEQSGAPAHKLSYRCLPTLNRPYLAPAAFFPFSVVRIGLAVLLPLSAVLAALPWIHARPPTLSQTQGALILILTLASYPLLEPLCLPSNREFSSLGSWPQRSLAATTARYKTAGLLLALATMKPHMASPMILWFFIWTMPAWHRRKSLILTFCRCLLCYSHCVPQARARSPGSSNSIRAEIVLFNRPATALLQACFGLKRSLSETCWRSVYPSSHPG